MSLSCNIIRNVDYISPTTERLHLNSRCSYFLTETSVFFDFGDNQSNYTTFVKRCQRIKLRIWCNFFIPRLWILNGKTFWAQSPHLRIINNREITFEKKVKNGLANRANLPTSRISAGHRNRSSTLANLQTVGDLLRASEWTFEYLESEKWTSVLNVQQNIRMRDTFNV